MNHGIALGILFVVAVFGTMFLLGAAASPHRGGEVGQCYYVDTCRYENEGFGVFVGYNYHVCAGAWAGYGDGWVKDLRCVYPAEKPRRGPV
jgi:hypothetical protein